jgi:hypothetical protein
MQEQELLPGLRTPLDENEPVFIIRARDPLAPWLVDMWASMRRGDLNGALLSFAAMSDVCINRFEKEPTNSDKINSADNVAINMRNYRLSKNLK